MAGLRWSWQWPKSVAGPSALEQAVEEETPAVQQLLNDAVGDVLEIGRRMQRVHDAGQGAFFQTWVKCELLLSKATASRYLNAVKYFGHRPSLAGFQPTAVFLLSRKAVPESARDEACRLAALGERITVRKAREIANSHLGCRPRRPQPQLPQMVENLFTKLLDAIPGIGYQLFPNELRIIGQAFLEEADEQERNAPDGGFALCHLRSLGKEGVRKYYARMKKEQDAAGGQAATPPAAPAAHH